MGNGGLTIAQMMNAKTQDRGPVPQQAFYGSNIAGTPVPKVGAAQSTQGASNAGQFAGVKPMTLAIIVVAIIGVGYVLHHVTFEEGVSARAG